MAVITSSINTFVSIAASITSSQREDVRGVAILLYTSMERFRSRCHLLIIHLGLLKDETTEIDFVGPTLSAFKTLLDLPILNGSDDKDRYNRLAHALLSTCLLNIDSMRWVSSWSLT